MYNISTPSIDSVVRDNQIKLPRYQRKKTWKDSKRFELCISIFKGYPMGTIVIKKETTNNMSVKWLLDGRQRRDTFIEMQNPENIAKWGNTYFNFNSKMTPQEKETIFTNQIFEYMQNEDENKTTNSSEKNTPICTDYVDCTNSPSENTMEDQSLSDLKHIVSSIKVEKNGKTDFGKCFLLKNCNQEYIRTDNNGKKYVDTNKLIRWIDNKLDTKEIKDIELNDIVEWFNDEKLNKQIEKQFANMIDTMEMIQSVKNRMLNTNSIVIELDSTCKNSDDRKIFEIINTKGEPLTGAEILSAKPTWNVPIESPRDDIIDNVENLYKSLEIDRSTCINDADVVRWDVAATFVNRLPIESDFILGDVRSDNFIKMAPKIFSAKMTIGFKLMSAYYEQSITKDAIDNLPNAVQDWNSKDIENDISNVCKILLKDQAFVNFRNMRVSIWKLLSNTIGYNFLFLMIKKLGNLTVESTGREVNLFLQTAHVLLDKLFYEYITGKWSGSSDSRLMNNLSHPEQYAAYEKIKTEYWDKIIDDIFYNNMLNGSVVKKIETIKILNIYFALVTGKTYSFEKENESLELDHIIPVSRLVNENSKYKDWMFNTAFLPKHLNNAKKNKPLSSLTDNQIDCIIELENLSTSDVSTIDKIIKDSDFDGLKKIREHYVSEIKKGRNDFVECMGKWQNKI